MYKVLPSVDRSQSPKDILPTALKTAFPPSSVGSVLSADRLRVGSVPAKPTLNPAIVSKLIPVTVPNPLASAFCTTYKPAIPFGPKPE